jgi:hypothetical protein
MRAIPAHLALLTAGKARRASVLIAALVAAAGLSGVAAAQSPPELVVDRSQVITAQVAGYGGQLNGRVYAAISRSVGVTDDNVQELQRKFAVLQPQIVRVFVNVDDLNDPDRRASLARALLLAQWSGATINLTWQGGMLDVAGGTIPKLAAFITEEVPKIGGLRWLTIQNEPNSTKITLPAYEAQYRAVDPYLANVRGQVRYMGGDLVQGAGDQGQAFWFQYMATHMADILDAWSIHVFWDYWDTQKLVDRLTGVRQIYDGIASDARKPLYVTEYGVRGLHSFNGVAADPGFWQDGTPMARTNVAAFQQAWFDVLAARLGYVGTLKWDLHFAKYDNGTQGYWLIGSPSEGWPALPAYNALHLFTATVKPGWSVVAVDGDAGTKLVTAYTGPDGALTLIGLDTAGAQLNTVSPTSTSYSIGGLPPQTMLHLVLWNEIGDGTITSDPDVQTDSAGIATFTVPTQAVFALTTMPSPQS